MWNRICSLIVAVVYAVAVAAIILFAITFRPSRVHGATPEEVARAAVAVELAKLSLKKTKSAAPKAPEVAIPKGATFRSGDYHASHRCPKCKHESAPRSGTWIVRGFNADNTHTHACPNCGTTWRH